MTVKYTEKQKLEFKKRFRQTWRYQMALSVPLAGVLLLIFSGKRYVAAFGLQQVALSVAFLLLVAAGFSWLNWRCPGCRASLGKGLNPAQCPACGVALK